MDAKDIILPVAVVTMVAAGAATHAKATGYDSQLNQPSAWGSTCSKIDMTGQVMTYTPKVPANAIEKVIVKGGTENKVYTTAPFTNLTAPVNPNNGKPYAISHVIVCTKDSEVLATTTTEPKTESKTEDSALKPADIKETDKPAKADGNGNVGTDKKEADKPKAAVKTDGQAGKGEAVSQAEPAGAIANLPATGAGAAKVAGSALAAGGVAYAASRAFRRQ